MRILNKAGFTLAEILITIGIIGVVAALTIPVLMQNSNSKKFTTQFKKSLSTLNQAAIGAQAQYDMDYSTLTTISEDASCKSDTLSGGKYTLCGLFNNTLSAQTYLGKYGNVKGANLETPYAVTTKTLNPANYLFFSFADGALVAFNPNAKSCGVGVGQVITTDMLTSGKLKNCLGFVDVNGPNPPNSEVSCADGDTVISANTTCKVTNGSMGDIFPVVFHDGSVEPATNASLAAFLGGNGKEEPVDKPKTAAQLAADKVTSQKHKDILNSLDDFKKQALKLYKEAGYETLDTAAYRRGSGNTAVYKVTTDKNGNTSMEYVKMNDYQIFHD
ncbi:type II secretion system protein, partial [bacterium]|nr:type II secretion system protein [bacterium]